MKHLWIALIGLVCFVDSARAQNEPPAIVIWASSVDALVGQSKLLFDQIGLSSTAETFDGLIKAKLGPKGFAGIDPTRPAGVFLAFEPDPLGALVLPIAQPKDFFDLLERMQIKSTKEADGTYRLAVSVPIPVYAKVSDRFVAITILNKNGFDAKYDPAKLFPVQPTLISARLRIDLLPKDARQLAVSQLEDALQQAAKKNPPADTPAQKAFTLACQQTLVRVFAQVLQEGKEVAVDVNFDAKQKKLDANLSLTPQAGTPLAKSLAAAGTRISAMTPVPEGPSALIARINLELPDAIAKAFTQVVAEGYLEGVAGLQNAERKKQAKDLLDALLPSLETGEIDAVLRIVGPSGDKKMGAVVGVKAKNGDKLGAIFKSLAEDAKTQMTDAEKAKVMLDADSVGSTKIHRFLLPADRIKGGNDMLGDPTLSLAFGPNAIFAGIGWENGPTLKKFAESTKAGDGRIAHLKIDMQRLAPVVAASPEQLAAVPKTFTQPMDGIVQLDIVGGQRLSVNLSIRTPVVQFLRTGRK